MDEKQKDKLMILMLIMTFCSFFAGVFWNDGISYIKAMEGISDLEDILLRCVVCMVAFVCVYGLASLSLKVINKTYEREDQ